MRLLSVLGLALTLLAVCLPTGRGAAAQATGEVLRLSADTDRHPLSGWMSVLRDPSGRMGVEEVEQQSQSMRRLPGMLAAGFDSAAYWVRVPIVNDLDHPTSRLLEIGMPFLDHVEVHRRGETGAQVTLLGDRHPFNDRPFRHRSFVVPLDFQAGEAITLLLRVATTSSISLSATLWHPQAFAEAASVEAVLLGILHGTTLLLILSSLMQYLLLREKVYGLLALFGSSFEVSFLCNNGYAAQFLFPASPQIADGVIGVFAGLTLASGTILADAIMRVRERHPRIHTVYMLLAGFGVLAAFSPFLDQYRLVGGPLQVAGIYLCVNQVILATLWLIRGDKDSAIYLAAFGVLLVTYIVFALRNLGLIDMPYVDFGPQVGSVFQMILLSLGLTRKVVEAEQSRRRAEASLLAQARNLQAELEHRVELRTAELSSEITVRREAERRLQDSESQLREMLNTAPFPMIIVIPPDGVILYANRPAQALLGCESELTPWPCLAEIFQTRNDFTDLVTLLAREDAVAGRDLTITRSDGEPRYLLASAVRFGYQGRDAIMLCVNDITSRRHLELEMIEARTRSEQALEIQRLAMRDQRNFLAMISHEFKTPLSVITAAADVIEMCAPMSDGTSVREVSKVRKAVKRLTGLIDSLLAEDWLDSTMSGDMTDRVDVSQLLAELIPEMQTLTDARLELSLPPGPVLLKGSPNLLRVMFSNLIENGLKYSETASEDAVIRVEMSVEIGKALVRVKDEGPGIPLGEEEHIFEKFIRLSSAANRVGVGLGLHLVRRIAAHHHGSAILENPGCPGACFLITLPMPPA